MDDTQKPNSQTQNPTATVEPVQPVVLTPTQNPSSSLGTTDPTQPVSAPVGGKEGAVMPVAHQEWVAPSTPEITPPAEVAPFMEVKSEMPHIPQAVAQAGVKLAKEATQVKTSTVVELDKNFNLQTPNTVLTAIKKAHGSVKESVRWLVELVGLAKKKEELLAKDKPEGGSF